MADDERVELPAAAPVLEPKFDLQKNSYAFAISREMAVDMGLAEPTYDEKMRTYEWALKHRQEKAAARALFEQAKERIAALDPVQLPLATKLLAIHAPDETDGLPPKCSGCPSDDYGLAGWPCSIVELVCREPYIAIELPVSSDIDDDYEPVHPDDQPPWEPFRVRDLFPQAFVNMEPIVFDTEVLRGDG